MKVIAFRTDEEMLVAMNTTELANICGIKHAGGLATFFDIRMYANRIDKQGERTKVLDVDIPMSDIYTEAVEIIEAYKELHNKLVSVRNQMSFLTSKMSELSPEKGGKDAR